MGTTYQIPPALGVLQPLLQAGHFARSAAKNSVTEYEEWSSLFSSEIFVKLVLYADESGTHDEHGIEIGSSVPVIGGYIAYKSEWNVFCDRWKDVLDEYDLLYFHYREWRNAFVAKKNAAPATLELLKNPFYKLDCNGLLELQYALAEVAGIQIPIGGLDWLQKRREIFPGDDQFAFNPTFKAFFEAVIEAINERPYLSEKIAFIMDQNTPEWEYEFTKVHFECAERGVIRSNERSFVNKKDNPPLQAADMYAYRARQLAVPRMEQQAKQPATVLDIMLNRNMHPRIGFRPTMTDTLRAEIDELAGKYESVRRALSEIPNNNFGLK